MRKECLNGVPLGTLPKSYTNPNGARSMGFVACFSSESFSCVLALGSAGSGGWICRGCSASVEENSDTANRQGHQEDWQRNIDFDLKHYLENPFSCDCLGHQFDGPLLEHPELHDADKRLQRIAQADLLAFGVGTAGVADGHFVDSPGGALPGDLGG